VGEGVETWKCRSRVHARHRGAAAFVSGEEAISKAGRPAAFSLREGEEIFKQYVRDMLI